MDGWMDGWRFIIITTSVIYNRAVIEMIQSPLQIWFIGKMYRLSAVCNEQIKQK